MENTVNRSGFIAIVGRPNVGKSTLLNRLVGQKVAIVSQRPQTTRNRILGVLTEEDCQMVFLDTPGLHRPHNKLGDFMVRQAERAVRDVDMTVLMVEPSERVEGIETEVLRLCEGPVLLAINKIDTVRKDALLGVIAAYAKAYDFAALLPISARTGEGVEVLKQELIARLPEGPAFFPADMSTDQTERQLLAEFVREKALRNLDQEVPHGIAVEIEQFCQHEDGLLEVGALIYCEKNSHKGIIIGAGGERLKHIASSARVDMERLMGCKVYLSVFVKVRENWRDSARMLRSFGYREGS
ncbi:MAG: GTPase Era [Clostridiales bacterium]|nr:GTPase Era [Clostridiales bacterium]